MNRLTTEFSQGELKLETGPIAGSVSLILNRPSRKNALSRNLVLALGEQLQRLSLDDSVRVIVLRGSGGSFCSGADLTSIVNATTEDPGTAKATVACRIDEFHQLITTIVHAPQPVIAVVDGPAVGFGADLALCCDMRVFTQAGYIEEGFVKVGLMPDGGGSYFMPRFAGARAFEYLALGSRLSAERCAELGIANAIVNLETLESTLEGWTLDFTRAAPLALRQIKQAVRRVDRQGLGEALAVERAGQIQLATSADFQEGVRAFLEKRPPQFRGE